MFRFLASVVGNRELVWDCATGNGQAAVALAEHFDAVVATDASQAQIDAAIPHRRVSYRTASAESSGLPSSCCDLLTVGQALHWFDTERFFVEARRVLRPDGVLALWSYQLCNVSAQCDAIVYRLYEDIVGEFWPPERVIVEQEYAGICMPGRELTAPKLTMSLAWQADDMLGFLRTWSACHRYKATHGEDPVSLISAELKAAWGAADRTVEWPLNLKVRRLNG
jgi:SAM-dependent methyltransferase